MIINVLYDASAATAPAGFQTAISAVVSYFQGHFTDDITFDLHVGFGDVHGNTMNVGNLGQSEFYAHGYSYQDFLDALEDHRTTADDFTAFSSLPTTSPFASTDDFWVMDPLAAALGLLEIESGSPIEGWVGFSNTLAFDYDRSDGITAGQYDFMGTVAHEITEIMGRVLGVGEDVLAGDGVADYLPLDLFHYASGALSLTRGGYFSLDGTTMLADFNALSTGDAGDWGGTTKNDAYLAFSSPGVYNDIAPWDLQVMDVLGFQGYPDDYGEDVNFAWHITPGQPQHGAIELSQDKDWFRVYLEAGKNYSIQMKGADSGGGTLADPFLAVFNSSSSMLAQDNDSGLGLDAALAFAPSTSGYYYLSASAPFGAGTGDYTLSVSIAPKLFNEDLPIDTVSDRAVSHLPSFLGGNHILSKGRFATDDDITFNGSSSHGQHDFQELPLIGVNVGPHEWG
jgi:hypothetical protein